MEHPSSAMVLKPPVLYLPMHLFPGTWGNLWHKGECWQERVRVTLLSLASALGFCGGFCCTLLGLDSTAGSTLVLAHPENPVSEKLEIRFLHSSRAGCCQWHLHPHHASPCTSKLLPGHNSLPASPASCARTNTNLGFKGIFCPPHIPLYLCSGEMRESSHPCWHQPSPECVC